MDLSEDRKYMFATAGIAIIALWPVLFPLSDMWDGDRLLMHQMMGATSVYETLLPYGFYLFYWLRLIFHEISMLTGVPHKLITNVISFVAVLGIARETFRYLQEQFGLSRKNAYIGSWAVLAFPIWHILLSSVHIFYVLFLWLFMLAVNLRHTHRWLALALFLISLQYFSLFPLAIGFACVRFVMVVNRDNLVREGAKTFGFALALLIGFIVLGKLTSLHGSTGTYNTLNLRELESFVQYFVLVLVSTILWFLGKRFAPDKLDWNRLGHLMLAFWVLVLFASLTYWAVGRPFRYFAFGSFTARHTILTCIPFALMVAGVAEACFSAFSPKRVWVGIGVVFLALVVILYQGHSHKVAALLFKDMLTQSFKGHTPPPSGFVAVFTEGYKPPRHVHQYSINLCLYKAYGESKWMANGFWQRQLIPTRKAMEKLYPADLKAYWPELLAMNVTGDEYTAYTFKLDNYHQEGRFWYWYHYFAEDYDVFNPKLILKDE